MRRCCLLALPALFLLAAAADTRGQDEHPVVKLIKSKVKDPAKPFALLVTFEVKEGNEKAFEAAFRPCVEATKKEPGCISYELNRDPERPTSYVMYEKFRGVPAIEAHLAAEHTKTLLKAVVPMCVADPQVKVFTVPE